MASALTVDSGERDDDLGEAMKYLSMRRCGILRIKSRSRKTMPALKSCR